MGIAESIAQAMAETEYSDEVYDKVEAWNVNSELFVAKTKPMKLYVTC